jgi:NitT/TauT family transport system substrate-binding protein
MKIYQKLFLVLLLVVVGSCSAPPPPQVLPLKISLLPTWSSFSVIFVAQDRGLFAKYGVSVLPVSVTEYMDGIKLYKENQVDGAFIGLTDTIALEAEGVSSRFVYASDYSETSDVIMGSPTLNSLSELKGKKVSFDGFNSFSHILVLKLLEKAGIHEGEFQTANIPYSEVLEALETGKIQAGHTYGPLVTKALAKGYKILGVAGDIPQLVTEGLVVNANVVNTRHEEVQNMVKALVEAMDFLQHSPEAGLRIIAKHNSISEAELALVLKGVHVLNLKGNQEAFKPDGILLKGGKEIADFLHQKGVLLNAPDLNKIMDGQFVNAIGNKP